MSRPENWRGSVQAPRVPQLGHGTVVRSTSSGLSSPFFSAYSSCRWSARNRLWQDWHSVSGSVKVSTWPLASHTWRGRMIEESRPTMSSRCCTIAFHHWRLMFSFSSTPSGP